MLYAIENSESKHILHKFSKRKKILKFINKTFEN